MSKKRQRRQAQRDRPRRGAPSAFSPRALTWWTSLLPVLVAVVLCLPDLRLGYIWDDYYFLTFRGEGDYRIYLLPDAHAAFYRPIPQGLYFILLGLLDPGEGALGHVLNLAMLGAAIALMVSLVTRLAGPRAGLLSGLVLASYGLVPGLVAWISCGQDLLAVVFVLAAFLLRHQGKSLAALTCAAAALLCKEPAIAAFPVLVLWDRLVGRPAVRTRLHAAAYALVFLVWILIHPGLRLLAAHGFRSGATGYVGIEHPDRWGTYLVRYLMSLANLTPPGLTSSWWDERIPYGLAALVILVGGFLLLDRRQPQDRSVKPLPAVRVAWIAALLGIPTLLMPTLLIRHWAPYFAFMPAVGLALFLGPFLARQRTIVSLTTLAIFLVLGVRYRGIRAESEPVWTERVLVDAANAARTVRRNFHTLFHGFPKGSQVIVSVSSTGVRGVYGSLIEGQALRVWYRDPTLQTVSPLHRRPGAPAEYLVRVTTDLDVISIDPDTHRVRSTTSKAPDLTEIGRPIVNYARALAASGETDRAARIAMSLAESESGPNISFVRRAAAMILIAGGRRDEATRVLATVGPLATEDALWSVKPFLTETSASERLDEAAFEAFGLSGSDPETIRWIMRHFQREGAFAQAAWYAVRLRRLAPGDPEGGEVIGSAKRMGIEPRRESG
jgi:hypothetical protein